MKENKITTYVDENLYKEIADNAADLGQTISSYIRMVLTQAHTVKQNIQPENKAG
jgi:antitoxin component of RelBE/YafQ-DinJ toxin-antitoxin module